jgi:hypothetical protein
MNSALTFATFMLFCAASAQAKPRLMIDDAQAKRLWETVLRATKTDETACSVDPSGTAGKCSLMWEIKNGKAAIVAQQQPFYKNKTYALMMDVEDKKTETLVVSPQICDITDGMAGAQCLMLERRTSDISLMSAQNPRKFAKDVIYMTGKLNDYLKKRGVKRKSIWPQKPAPAK